MTSPEGVIDLEGHGCHLVRAKQKRRPASLSGRGDICGQLVLSASLILLLGGGGGHAPSLLAKAEIFQYDNMEMKVRGLGYFAPVWQLVYIYCPRKRALGMVRNGRYSTGGSQDDAVVSICDALH